MTITEVEIKLPIRMGGYMLHQLVPQLFVPVFEDQRSGVKPLDKAAQLLIALSAAFLFL